VNEHQRVRQEILDLIKILVPEGGLKYADIEIMKPMIDSTVERILKVEEV